MKNKVEVALDILMLNEDGYHVFVKCAAAGHPIRMLVDTGASRTVFDLGSLRSIHSEIHLESNDDLAVGLGAGGIENFIATIDNFVVGDAFLGTITAGVLELSHVNESYARIDIAPITGVLGSDLLVKHNAVIDYGSKKLVLTVKS